MCEIQCYCFLTEWHFDNVTQLPLITLVADEGYVFAQDFNQKVHALNKKGNRKSDLSNIYGATGYDNRLESMKTFMVVAGPSFASEPGKPEHFSDHLLPLFKNQLILAI